MKLLQNKTFTIVAVIIISIIAVFASSLRSLNSIKQEAQLFFIEGDGEFSVAKDLSKKSAIAGNAVTLYKKYTKTESSETTIIENLRRELEASIVSPEKAAEISRALTLEFGKLYAAMPFDAFSASDKSILGGLLTDLNAVDDILSRTEYNDFAAMQNTKLHEFPLGIFKALTFTADIQYFVQ